ncbi:hypothetical protein M3Y97_00712200 [Aphelenchoides bicaudatus]|nr:hypothetical protein M3Y97_00712200 [Aphelenchoides bicaudatus]
MTQETCFCGVHVTAATKIFAWIYLVFRSLSLIVSLVFMPKILETAQEHKDWSAVGTLIGCFVELIVIIFTGLLLYGVYKKKPNFYWPFIVYSFISVVMLTVLTVLLSILFVFGLFDPQFEMKDYNNLLLPTIIVLALLDVIFFYFGFLCPNRSRKCLLDERYKALLGY